jgi:hypothetical protein
VEILGADTGQAQPDPNDLIAFLRIALQSMAQQRQAKGIGICANVGARLPGYEGSVDAICCFIDRAGRPPIDFYVPCAKGFWA